MFFWIKLWHRRPNILNRPKLCFHIKATRWFHPAKLHVNIFHSKISFQAHSVWWRQDFVIFAMSCAWSWPPIGLVAPATERLFTKRGSFWENVRTVKSEVFEPTFSSPAYSSIPRWWGSFHFLLWVWHLQIDCPYESGGRNDGLGDKQSSQWITSNLGLETPFCLPALFFYLPLWLLMPPCTEMPWLWRILLTWPETQPCTGKKHEKHRKNKKPIPISPKAARKITFETTKQTISAGE